MRLELQAQIFLQHLATHMRRSRMPATVLYPCPRSMPQLVDCECMSLSGNEHHATGGFSVYG